MVKTVVNIQRIEGRLYIDLGDVISYIRALSSTIVTDNKLYKEMAPEIITTVADKLSELSDVAIKKDI